MEQASEGRSDVRSQPRDIQLCTSCAHFEEQNDTPYCNKFHDVADDAVGDCGGPY